MKALALAAAFGLVATVAGAQTVTAAWNANQDAYTVGYRLYYGTASGSYQWSIDTGSSTSAPVQLSPGTYYFAVKAYNATNDEGPPSGEVPFTLAEPPPPPPPTDPCVADPLRVTVTQWPANKRSQPTYTSNYPSTYRYTSVKGQTVNVITFTDNRTCTQPISKP